MKCIVNVYYEKIVEKFIQRCWFFEPGEGVMEFLVILVLLIVLAIAAMRWGAISLDGPDSPEWERRQRWHGFH